MNARTQAGYDHRFDAIQDKLLELRDSGISFFPAPNGLVACTKDGTPSSIIRMSIPDTLRVADRADAEQGIVRVAVSDEAIERACSRYYASWPQRNKYQHSPTFVDVLPHLQERIRVNVRAVIAALREDQP